MTTDEKSDGTTETGSQKSKKRKQNDKGTNQEAYVSNDQKFLDTITSIMKPKEMNEDERDIKRQELDLKKEELQIRKLSMTIDQDKAAANRLQLENENLKLRIKAMEAGLPLNY
jgi:hypothetical protein